MIRMRRFSLAVGSANPAAAGTIQAAEIRKRNVMPRAGKSVDFMAAAYARSVKGA
jgi:hypothetical protein